MDIKNILEKIQSAEEFQRNRKTALKAVECSVGGCNRVQTTCTENKIIKLSMTFLEVQMIKAAVMWSVCSVVYKLWLSGSLLPILIKIIKDSIRVCFKNKFRRLGNMKISRYPNILKSNVWFTKVNILDQKSLVRCSEVENKIKIWALSVRMDMEDRIILERSQNF